VEVKIEDEEEIIVEEEEEEENDSLNNRVSMDRIPI
jgi:hypothetical protein